MSLKKCPSCGYRNRGDMLKCGVCACDISMTEPELEDRYHPWLFPVLLLIACAFGAYYFFPLGSGKAPKKDIETIVPEEAVLEARTLSYSLENLGVLKFPSEEEEKAVFLGLKSHDPSIRKVSVSTLLLWASFRGPGHGAYLVKACSAFSDKSPEVRTSVAVMLAEILKREIFSPADIAGVLPDPVFLMEDPDKDARIAGAWLLLFLERREGVLPAAYRNFISSSTDTEKAYYACLLARYGEKGFDSTLKDISFSKDNQAAQTASFCLKRFFPEIGSVP